MENDTDQTTILLLNQISFELNRCITLFVALFGTIGNLLNIIVLLQRPLRSNPSVIYFLGSSIAGLGIILAGIPTRIIAGWISTDPSNTNTLLCKCRIFFLYSFRSASVWLIVLASLDRWFTSSSCIHRRRWSSVRIAYRGVFVIYCLAFFLWIQSIYCYDINVPQAPLECYGKSHVCRFFNDLVYASSTVIIPSIFMLIIGLMTIHNINRSRRTVVPSIVVFTNNATIKIQKQRTVKRRQHSLTRMLLFQVILLTICSLPQAIHQIYLSLTLEVVKSSLRQAIENFIVDLDFSLTYVGNGIPFYIYTLTGTIFRRTLFRLVQLAIRRVFRC